MKGGAGVAEGRREFGRRKWPTEPQTQITSQSNRQSVDQSTHGGERGEGPVNNSNAPEEVLVWEEMDALT